MIFAVLFVCLLAVSAVSASDANDTVTASAEDDLVVLSSSNVLIKDNSTLAHADSTYGQLKMENDDEKLSVLNDENVLSSAETFNGTTFSELRSKSKALRQY